MQRYIPGKTKVKTEFWKGVTVSDLITGLVALVGVGLILGGNLFETRVQIVVLLMVGTHGFHVFTCRRRLEIVWFVGTTFPLYGIQEKVFYRPRA